jgi:hypothetical protein
MPRKVELLPGADELSVHCPECGQKAGVGCWTRRAPFPGPCEPHVARIKLANDRRSTDA